MDTYNYYKLTNNSSRDLQIMPIEQQQHHIMNQIPTHDDQYHDHHNINPLFPNYPPQYYSSISPPSSSLCLDPPPYNSINISSTLLLTSSTDQDHDHDYQELTVEDDHDDDDDQEELGAMKEMMYKIAAMQPVDIDPATIRRPKRRNVRISDDPQSVAARLRRERISERMRILQRLVPGGTKMDTASMLDEAIRYVKFLKRQIRFLQSSSVISNNNIATNSPCLASSTDNVIKWVSGFQTN